MKYDEIFARSFSRNDQKKFGYGALVSCFVVAWCLCTVFKPYLTPLPILNLRLTMVDGLKLMMVNQETSIPQESYVEVKETKVSCNSSNQRSDSCEINGDVRIQGNSSTIFVVLSHMQNQSSWTIKPYARKGDQNALKSVTNFTIKPVQNMPECSQTHNAPAIVFSAGGYSGNNFHAFTDVIIPLYAASRQFNGEVRFLVSNKYSQWTHKFQEILKNLSRYEIIDIDKENETHCFPSMILGLKKERKELSIDPSTSRYTMNDFRAFLRSTYALERAATGAPKRPRLLVVTRKRTRAFTNERDVVGVARAVGFEVVAMEPNANLTRVSKLVYSCDVMLGVHGAGLTNMVFLPENGVVIQIVPWGEMGWLARTSFGEPSKEMGLKYLEYKIREGESSLIEQYPIGHQVLKDPSSVQRRGWSDYKSIYLDKQNVKLDVVRFRETLSKALELLHG